MNVQESPAPSRAATSNGRGFFQLLLSNSPVGRLLIVELSVVLATAFLVLRFVHGAIRRRVALGRVATLMDFVHILTLLLITYIIGLMHSVNFLHELFPVWAYVLIYIYGGVDTSTAHRLSDNEQGLGYTFRVAPLSYWAAWLAVPFIANPKLLAPLVILWFMSSFNSLETLKALALASKSKGLPKLLEPVVEYMRKGHTEASDPMGMRGCSYYLFQFEGGDDTITTTEDVWRSQTTLLLPSSDSLTCARSEGLKDMALSLAWFWLLLRRFAGFASHEIHDQSTRGFLSTEPAQVDRLFRILEVELGLLYDLFYTKYFLLATRQSHYKLRRILCIPFFLWFAFITLYKDGIGAAYPSFYYFGHNLEIALTRVVLLVIALLEICQIGLLFLSNWKILILLCQYVKNPNSHSCFISNETLIICIWAIKDRLSISKFLTFFRKPWQRKLGQYSIIECFAKRPISRKPLKWLLGDFGNAPRVGQVGDFSVALTIEVKCALVSSLLSNSLKLSPGIATLERYELLSKLHYAWQTETDAEVILIWHIATSACEFKSTPAAKNKDKHFTVATQISRYCAYLVTFSPELLTDHPHVTELVFDKAVQEALALFNGLDLEERYLKMMTITEIAEGSNVVEKGAVLGRELIEHVLGDSSKGWRVLAEFWAELLLCMTPSTHEEAHGMHLAQGGEFITHLWALLTHAGVVTRDSSRTPVVLMRRTTL